MSDIYDRANWPSPESNPLIVMLESGEEWFSNKDVNRALDPSPGRSKRSVLSNWPTLAAQLEQVDSRLDGRHFGSPSCSPAGATGGLSRYWSRKALIIIAMRAQTVNAAAFRDWLASKVAGEIGHG